MARIYTPVVAPVSEPAQFGIVNSKTDFSESAERWENGLDIESFACNTNVKLLDFCTPDGAEDIDVVEANGNSSQQYLPVTVQTEYVCSTFGFKHQDYEKRARDAMESCQNKAIEHELWTGDLAKQNPPVDDNGDPVPNGSPNRYLASSAAEDVTPTAGTAVKPSYGLALLEEALANCGCGVRGFVHATRGVASTLKTDVDGDILKTKLGTYVIAGSGYKGTGPNGQPASGSAVWMYATGPVTVRLGEVTATPETLAQSIDTSTNAVRVTAERPFAVTWDGCCHFAVLVDLSLDYT